MGQSQSNKQNNEYFNSLIMTLVQTKSEEESVIGEMNDLKEKVQLQHGIIPDYLSAIIVITSL